MLVALYFVTSDHVVGIFENEDLKSWQKYLNLFVKVHEGKVLAFMYDANQSLAKFYFLN